MKNRFWLFRRNGIFYLQDAQSRGKESLHTRDRREAGQIRDARNAAAESPVLGAALAKAYLSARDPQVMERTWQNVFKEYSARGNLETQADRRRLLVRKPYSLLRHRKVVETTATEFLMVLNAGGVKVNTNLRCLHNLAQGLGWLPWPILPPKMWPVLRTKPKRGITAEEHRQVMSSEKNAERRLYYELLWETGASQSDGAALKAENVDWEQGVLTYQRKKTGEWSHLRIGEGLAQVLRQLPAEGSFFKRIGTNAKSRASEFFRRCRLLGIRGISLHSYRYAWAERAQACGYPERFAQKALGHSSKAVHRAYARNAQVTVPPLDEFQKQLSERKIIPLSRMATETGSEPPAKTVFGSG